MLKHRYVRSSCTIVIILCFCATAQPHTLRAWCSYGSNARLTFHTADSVRLPLQLAWSYPFPVLGHRIPEGVPPALFPFTAQNPNLFPPIVLQHLVVQGDLYGNISAITINEGLLKWKKHVDPRFVGETNAYEDSVVASTSSSILRLRLDGSTLWKCETDGYYNISVGHDRVVAVNAKAVFALSIENGKVIWKHPNVSPNDNDTIRAQDRRELLSRSYTPVISDSQIIFYPSPDGGLRARTLRAGNVVYVGNEPWRHASSVTLQYGIMDNTLYVKDIGLSAYDATSLTLKWRRPGTFDAPRMVLRNDSIILVEGLNIVTLSGEDGTTLSSIPRQLSVDGLIGAGDDQIIGIYLGDPSSKDPDFNRSMLTVYSQKCPPYTIAYESNPLGAAIAPALQPVAAFNSIVLMTQGGVLKLYRYFEPE
jgi:outer membrane protein assembly factor BamB